MPCEDENGRLEIPGSHLSGSFLMIPFILSSHFHFILIFHMTCMSITNVVKHYHLSLQQNYYLTCFREILWKFFYPAEYQEMEVTQLPEAGQLRIWKSFDFKMVMQDNSTLDVLFTKNKVRVCRMKK